MVTRRWKGREDSPPPKYDSGSCLISVILHFGGRNGFKLLWDDFALIDEAWRGTKHGNLLHVYLDDGVEEAIDVEVGYETIDEGVGYEAIDVEVGNETINEGVGNEDDDVTDGRADVQLSPLRESDFEDDDEGVEIQGGSVEGGTSKGKGVEVGTDSSEGESGDEDVVCDGDGFDENRISDDEGGEKFPVFNTDVIFNPSFEVGMIFGNRDDLKRVVQSHAIQTKRSISFPKIDKIRVYARCKAEGCNWGINLLKMHEESTFQIREYRSEHKCAPVFKVCNLKSTWLGKKFISDFQNDPNRKLGGWRKDKIRALGIGMTQQQAYRSRTKALELIGGVPAEQYSKLWDYVHELKRSNLNSTIVLDNDEEGRFRGIYVCFEAARRGFKSGCRPFIGVDGCWLKGTHGGILLTAVGVDPSNAIYPNSWAVVSRENKDTWTWFLLMLKRDLVDPQSPTEYTFMSDKQKGLIQAFNEVFPGSDHRFCVRHLHNNFQKVGFRGLTYKNALWRCARATTVRVFNLRMQEMRDLNPTAADWFVNKHPSEWSKSHFSEKSKCDMLLNNVCESFNAAILEARDKPIITLLEWIRQWMMTRFQKCRDRANTKWEGRYPPKIKQILVKNMEMVGDCIPIKSNNRFYQIEFFYGKQFAVDLGMRTCSCSSWNLSGIPCNHAISAITNENLDPEDFLDDCYNIETYKRVYAPAILPIAGQTEWAPTLFIPPMPPNFGKKLGRPSSSRFAGIGDTKNVKKGKVLKLKKRHIESKCTTCMTSGHNSRSCPQSENARRQKRKADCEDVEAQGEDTQAQGEDAQAVGEDAQAVSEDAQPTTQVVTGPSMSEPPTKGKKEEDHQRVKKQPQPHMIQAMLSQDSCDVLSLGMKAVHCKVGPTPFQQLYEDYTSPYVPKMFSGPNIRAPPPFVHGGSRPQFTTQSQKESGMKRILVDGGQKFMDLTQESHVSGKGKKKV
ncbi:hypothetical protein ACS0TY_034073 [Phlomoides rotata]